MSWVLSSLLSVLSLAGVVVGISPQTYRPLMLLVGVWAIMRSTPTTGRYGQAADAAWVAAALFSLGWPLAQGAAFFDRAANPLPADVVAGTLAIIVVLEATRRTTGWILPISSVGMLAYAGFRGHDLSQLIGHLLMTLKGIYGVPLGVAATYLPLAAVGVSFVMARGDRLTPRRFFDTLAAGGKRALPFIAIAAVAGLMIGVVRVTGLF
jgi:TRAP-type uncharacterized transport system fused permease subunit